MASQRRNSSFRSIVHHVRIGKEIVCAGYFLFLSGLFLCTISLAQEIGCEGQQVLYRPQTTFLSSCVLLFFQPLFLVPLFFFSALSQMPLYRNSPGPSRTPCSITGYKIIERKTERYCKEFELEKIPQHSESSSGLSVC